MKANIETERQIMNMVTRIERAMLKRAELTAQLEEIESEIRSLQFVLKNLRGARLAQEISDKAARLYGVID